MTAHNRSILEAIPFHNNKIYPGSLAQLASEIDSKETFELFFGHFISCPSEVKLLLAIDEFNAFVADNLAENIGFIPLPRYLSGFAVFSVTSQYEMLENVPAIVTNAGNYTQQEMNLVAEHVLPPEHDIDDLR